LSCTKDGKKIENTNANRNMDKVASIFPNAVLSGHLDILNVSLNELKNIDTNLNITIIAMYSDNKKNISKYHSEFKYKLNKKELSERLEVNKNITGQYLEMIDSSYK
ncbi:MAG: hypothetical protein JXJ19_00175, partial [Elusimicrobia bacterium]|nr:hypothetical protein [Elusimicrobiota bacterium]